MELYLGEQAFQMKHLPERSQSKGRGDWEVIEELGLN